VAIVHQATSPRQQVVIATLSTIAAEAAKAGIRPPALIIVGGVVALRERFAWFEKLPLFGRTVLVTRTREQASQLTERLSQLGAEVLEAPTIAVEPPASYDAVDAALGRLGEFDWLVLTSPNGVASMLDRMQALGMDARALAGTRVAAVGPATAEALQERLIRADVAPEEGTTEALGVALGEKGSVKGKRVLLARADIATEDLANILRRAGAGVEEVALYRTVPPASLPPEAVDALKAGRVDWITFTSSSTVENFLKLTAALDLKAAQAKIAAIGPVTAKTLQTHGLSPTVVAWPHTIPGLVEAIVRFEAQTCRG
jgi:uroporphyrinogen III methyltransferase/synthase